MTGDVNSRNAVMHEQGRIREAVMALQPVLVEGGKSELCVSRAEVLRIIRGAV